MRSSPGFVLLIVALAVTAARAQNTEQRSAELSTPDYQRGRRLHDDACTGCHGYSMYQRAERERNPYFTVRRQVEIWQDFIGLNWSAADIADVSYFVQTTYYDQVCTTTTC